MKFFTLAVLVFAAIGLVGCAAKPLEVASITKIKAPVGTQGVDVYAARRASGEQVPAFAGEHMLEVRSYHGNKDDLGNYRRGKEMSGANCTVEASNFSANVVTPAKVRVPVYRAQSSPLSVACQKDGYRQKSQVVSVYNKTKSDRTNNASSVGATGGIVGALAAVVITEAINAASDETTHDFVYAPAQLTMEPLSGAKTPSKTQASALGGPKR